MAVYLDVMAKLDRRAVEATAREITQIFSRLGANVSKDLSGALGKGFGAFDTTAARAELGRLENAWRRAADVEVDSARRMEVAAARASEAVAKYGTDSAKAMQAQALAARSQRDYADALVANEAAQQKHTRAMQDSAAATGMAGRAWNAVGIGSLAVFGVALVSSTDAAGNFQQSLEKLHTVAEELPSNLKTISDGVLQLTSQTGYSAQQLMDATFGIEKAGYRGNDAIKVLTVSAQLASEEQADLKDTISAVTTTMHDYHISVDQAATVTSKLNVAVGLSRVPLQEFSGALHNVEPVAAGVGESMNDLYASLAMLTQSGMGADQATQNLTHTITSLARPTKAMRDEMAALGVDWRDIQDHFSDRGLVGTANALYEAIQNKLGPSGTVMLDTWFKSQSVADSANEMMAAMPPNVRAVADEINNGTLSYAEFRKTRGGLSVEQANEIEQYKKLEDQLQGYNQSLKSGQGDTQSQIQALALLVGGQDNLRTVLQLVGENGPKAADAVKQVGAAQADADGKTKGFTESQETYNAKMRDLKGALSAARVELGQDFLPAMTTLVGTLGEGAHWLSEHKTIMDGLVGTVGALGAAYVGLKTALGFKHLVDDVKTSFFGVNTAAATANTTIAAQGPAAQRAASQVEEAAGREVAAEDTVTGAAGRARGALAGVAGPLSLGLLGGDMADDAIQGLAKKHPNEATQGLAQLFSIPGLTGTGTLDWLKKNTGLAAGGPVHGRGPSGIDSVHALLAPGEHVLTHHDVQAMGGHSGVYAFRQSLHGGLAISRQDGGAVGPDVQVAHSMVGAKYSQGSRWDCSGDVGRVVLGAMGMPANNLPTTKNMGPWLSALGFRQGIGGPGAISVGWYDHGPNPNDGHAAMTLSDGENAEGGGSHGSFLVGAGAAGASSSQFDHHMFLPTLYGEGAGGGMPGGMGGGGGFGAGGGAGGGGFGGMGGGGGGGGSYSQDPAKVQAAQDRLTKANERLTEAKEREAEVSKKATASESEKLKAHDEVLDAQRSLTEAQQGLAAAQKGTFHKGGGQGGSPFLPVPLADKFGLGKGLPGVAEWAVGFLEDLVLGPMETAAMAAMGMGTAGLASGSAGMGGGGFGGAGFMPPGPGQPGFGAPGPLGGADFGGGEPSGGSGAPSGGSGAGPSSGGSGSKLSLWGWHPSSGSSGGERLSKWGWHGSSGPPIPTPPTPGSPDWFNSLLTGPSQGLSPGFHPGAGVGPDDDGFGLSVKSPWGVASDDTKSINKWLHGRPFGMDPIDAPRPGFSKMQVPPYTPPPPPPQPGLPPETLNMFMAPEHHASGGPVGTDTVPAWLTPNEMVMNTGATSQFLPQLQAMNAMGLSTGGLVPQYFDEGGGPVQPSPSQTPQNPGTPKPGPQPPGQGFGPLQNVTKATQPGQPGGAAQPGGIGAAMSPSQQGLAGLATPGKGTINPEDELPASQGIGFSGGALGAVEGAATSAAGGLNAIAPGAGSGAQQALQIGFQELNRAASYGAQAASIGVEGLLETFIPTDSSSGGDWMKTIPGRLLSGVAGARPSQPNTAGQTQQPSAGEDSGNQFASTQGPGNSGHTFHINGPMTVNANNPQELGDSIHAGAKAMATAQNTYSSSGINWSQIH